VQKINNKYIKSIVKQALREDLNPLGDITSKNIVNKKVTAKIIAGQKCIIGGLNFAKETFKISDKRILFKAKINDGKTVKKGKVLATLKGEAKNILKAERVALNFIGLISGVATITNKFVKKLDGKNCKICCTRKTLPNLRLIQKYAVRLGGGTNHRFNLSDEILIKDNHIKALGGIRNTLKILLEKKINYKIECDTLSQVRDCITAGSTYILLDNMSPTQVKKIINCFGKKAKFEVSGGVNLKNITKYSKVGANYISTSKITLCSKSVDISLDLI
jgi:nicotinate-nucleotide pyrophosphorylase (carboxylating)